MKTITWSYIVRGFTLIIGALSSIIVASLLIDHVGQIGYVKYVLLTSLPSLIPFADFGLGSNILNYFADKSKGKDALNTVSETFLLSTAISLLFVIVTLFSVVVMFQTSSFPPQVTNSQVLLGVGIISITFLAVPFSLGAKKMFAEERITIVFVLQGLIPPLTLLSVIACLYFNVGLQNIVYLAPSVAYLLTTLAIFFNSGIYKHFVKPTSRGFYLSYGYILRLGGWSLCVTTVVALVWQTPKYILQFTGSTEQLTEYALMSLFLIPGLSLTAVAGTWHTTNIRRKSEDARAADLTSRAIRNSQLAALLYSLIAAVGLMFLKQFELSTPTLSSQLIALVALLVSPSWLIPLSALTNLDDYKWVSVRIIPCFIGSNILFAITSSHNFIFAIILYAFSVAIPIRYFANSRLQHL